MTVPLAYNTTRRSQLTFNNLALFSLHTPTFLLTLNTVGCVGFFFLKYRLDPLSLDKLTILFFVKSLTLILCTLFPDTTVFRRMVYSCV